MKLFISLAFYSFILISLGAYIPSSISAESKFIENNEIKPLTDKTEPYIRLKFKDVVMDISQVLDVKCLPIEVSNVKNYTLSFKDGTTEKVFKTPGEYKEAIKVTFDDGYILSEEFDIVVTDNQKNDSK